MTVDLFQRRDSDSSDRDEAKADGARREIIITIFNIHQQVIVITNSSHNIVIRQTLHRQILNQAVQ